MSAYSPWVPDTVSMLQIFGLYLMLSDNSNFLAMKTKPSIALLTIHYFHFLRVSCHGLVHDGVENCIVNKTTGKVVGYHAWNTVSTHAPNSLHVKASRRVN
jgi:hypothetical protein